MKKTFFFITIILIGWVPQNIYAQQISLADMSSFEQTSDAWQIVGEIFVNPLADGVLQLEQGQGVLVGTGSNSDPNGETDLTTILSHGDIALEFDMLLSHGGAFELLLQGRYGLLLTDSWKDNNRKLSDSGGIVPPESGGVSSIGYNARLNVARSPGIWQRIKIVFEAPRFNNNGEKIRNARFTTVKLNGVEIQENQYLPSPSKGAISSNEVSQGPMVFRSKEEDVAIKNISYTIPSGQQVLLEELNYEIYVDKFLDEEFFYGMDERGSISIPDLASIGPTESGQTDLLNSQMTQGLGNEFVMIFNGKMRIPETGMYHFKSASNGIGKFQLDGKELFRWDNIHMRGNNDASVFLNKGSYSFNLTYVNFRQPQIELFVDGPGVINQALHEESQFPSDYSSGRPILLRASYEEPLMQRSFIFHERQKLLSCINVGYSSGIHYTINLETGSLVQIWRGDFANVTQMWHGRGLEQVLEPLGDVLSLTAEQQVLMSDDDTIQSVSELNYGDYTLTGYDLNSKTEPVFKYNVNGISIRDHITLGSEKRTLTRSLRFKNPNGNSQNLWYRLASAPSIVQVDKLLYAIDGKTFFIEIEEGIKAAIKQEDNKQVLYVPVQVGVMPELITYSLIW